jgi:hypothetical protein
MNEKRKSNHEDFNKNNPTKTFNESKIKSKPRSSSMQMKNVLSNQKENEKHQTLNSQPITGSQLVRHTQLQKSERKKMPNRAKE